VGKLTVLFIGDYTYQNHGGYSLIIKEIQGLIVEIVH